VLAAATIDAATDTDVFRTFVSDCLAPTLRPGMVVVMDNLSAYKADGIRKAIEATGCRLVYLPPYLPDLSPIEPIWSKAKSVLRVLEARKVEGLDAAVTLALEEITATDCINCFDNCGYSLHLT
jgi:transposase